MPTYDYRCKVCGRGTSVFQSIRDYMTTPNRPTCIHDSVSHEMERVLNVVPGMIGLSNALAGDRHYEGLRASDGTDISSRTKHREYMKRNNLTTVDDYKDTWKSFQKERAEFMEAKHVDKELRQEISQQVMAAVSQPT